MALVNKHVLNQFEDTYFSVLMFASVALFALETVYSFWSHQVVFITLINSCAAFLSLVLLIFYNRFPTHRKLMLKIYVPMSMMIFIVMWTCKAGIQGPYSYVYFTLVAIYTTVLRGKFKLYAILMLCLICLMLVNFSDDHQEPYSDEFLVIISYFFNSLVIGITALYLKWYYEYDHKLLLEHNRQLDSVNTELFTKRMGMLNQRQKTDQFKNNLEHVVNKHTRDLVNKNGKLSEIAFDNAHLLRAPLSNVLSLIDLLLMENKSNKTEVEKLLQLKEQAEHLDGLVIEVNQLVV